jgi:hypothetical protein
VAWIEAVKPSSQSCGLSSQVKPFTTALEQLWLWLEGWQATSRGLSPLPQKIIASDMENCSQYAFFLKRATHNGVRQHHTMTLAGGSLTSRPEQQFRNFDGMLNRSTNASRPPKIG